MSKAPAIFLALIAAIFALSPLAHAQSVPQQFINAQTGTSYTLVAQDCSKLVTLNNGSAIAVSLPQAGASFPAGCFIDVEDLGAGTATITATTSTIGGASYVLVTQSHGGRIVSDGTNYRFLGLIAGD